MSPGEGDQARSGDSDFVVVANRLPIDKERLRDGTATWKRSPGGLVTALEPLLRKRRGAWIGWPGLAEDDVNTIDDADDRSLDRHVLVSDRGARGFAERAHHHLTGARAEPVGDDNDIACRLLIEIVRMNNQKSDALEIRRLLCRPDCTYNFS